MRAVKTGFGVSAFLGSVIALGSVAWADYSAPGSTKTPATGERPTITELSCKTTRKQQEAYWDKAYRAEVIGRDLREKLRPGMKRLAKAIRATSPNIVTEFLEGRLDSKTLEARVLQLAGTSGLPSPTPYVCPAGYAQIPGNPLGHCFQGSSYGKDAKSVQPLSGRTFNVTASLPGSGERRRIFRFEVCEWKGSSPKADQEPGPSGLGCLHIEDYQAWEPTDTTYTEFRAQTPEERAAYGKSGGPQPSPGQSDWSRVIDERTAQAPQVSDPLGVDGEGFNHKKEYLCAQRNYMLKHACPAENYETICSQSFRRRLADDQRREKGPDAGVASANEGCRGKECGDDAGASAARSASDLPHE